MMLRGTRSLLSAAQKGAVARSALGRPVAVRAGPTCPPPFQRVDTSLALRLLPRASRAEYSTKPPLQPNKRDVAREKEVGRQKLESHPELVSTESSVRHVLEPSQAPPDDSRDVLRDAKEDIEKVKETFALSSVPRQPYALGLAGTLPYLATSISTVYLSWDLKTTWPTDSNFLNSFLVSHETATQWLQALEPIQIGYGAVIISFLGAIHWGLEYAEKAPSRPRTSFRYGIGLLAPCIAWPTMMFPIEWALTGQFLAFTGLYFADARATKRGWAPAWYSTYRFVLTAIVGATIVMTLVARAKIDDKSPRISTEDLNKIVQPSQTKYVNWARLEAEEKERIRREKKEQEKQEKKEKNEERQQKLLEEKGGASPSKQDESEDVAEESEDDTAAEDEASEDKSSEGKKNKK
ncbi:hypothetical protein GQ53DRAFT_722271 [Thozetella sp. PMI_491]|nr:hypothetical protein GQ53DRAFT_722271 [Thozetella sp. PMI_491]